MRRQYLKSVTNALRVLERLGDNLHEPIGLSDLARQLDLGKSTCHRLLTTLEARDFVFQDQKTGKYGLGPKMLLIAGRYLESTEVHNIAMPVLNKLAIKTGETAHIAILQKEFAIITSKVESENPFRMMSHIGWRAPLHSTAMGKVLLSFSQNKLLAKHIEQTQYTPNTITNRDLLEMELERIRERGWAIDDEETQLGVRCYAAPVKNYEGRVIAAISASGPIVRTTPRNKDFVVKAAKELSNKMGCPSC